MENSAVYSGKEQLIKSWLNLYGIKNYILTDDLKINVNGDVKLSNLEFIHFPIFIEFNEVNGNFDISCNKFKTLKGCPKKVLGYFSCANNNLLTSFEGSPEYIGGHFNFSGCMNIKSLNGYPVDIKGNVYCYGCDSVLNDMFREVIG